MLYHIQFYYLFNIICISLEKHEWLLSEDLDLLPRLLLPLAGPEQFDEEDNEKLPLDLQYLPDDKEREPDSDLRLALLQALTQVNCDMNKLKMIGKHLTDY